jgi:hypothetical protein
MLIGTGLQIHTKATVIIPAEIGRIMLGLVTAIPDPGLEYGLYLQGEWDPVNCVVRVKPDQYYFPEQETSAVSIRFLEEPPGPEWNVVVHRHPQSCRRFSSTDVNSINEEFLASVLYIPFWEFPDAVVNIPLAAGSKFQSPAKVVVEGELVDIPDWLRERAGTVLQQLRVVKAQGIQKAGRGTIEALDGDGTIKPEPERAPIRIKPRQTIRARQPAAVIGAPVEGAYPLGDHDHDIRQLPLLSGGTSGFAAEDLADIADAVRLSNLGINT